MQITIGIDISKETLAAYRLPDNQRIQVANDRAGERTLVRWIGKQNGSLVVFEATGAYHRYLEAAPCCQWYGICQGQSASGAQVCRSDRTIGQD
jgi:hypothetical protein